MLTHGSLFAGIGGFDLGFERAGFRTLWAVEKEPFCRAVLATHFPETELLNDVHYCGRHNLRAVDVITAGFPCQDLSVAGKRAGLAGARSGLFWQVVRILGECRPPWFVLENVPGLFSSNEGRDFAVVLNELDELGYGLAWRVLDSQFFGVAQRRRRVFIVGRLGAPCPAEVLFEPESSAGDFAESGETRQDVASTLRTRAPGSGGQGTDWEQVVANTIPAHSGLCAPDYTNYTVVGTLSPGAHPGGFNGQDAYSGQLIATAICANQGRTYDGAEGPRNLVACLNTFSGGPDDNDAQAGHIIIQDARGQRDKRQNGIGISEGGPRYTLDGTSEHAVAFTLPSVHRGLGNGHNTNYLPQCAPPDSDRMRDFAELPEGLDSPRYRALGNAVTQEVAYWIARRIAVWIARRIAALMPCLPEVKLHPVIGLEEK